jgi:hypothetical protein
MLIHRSHGEISPGTSLMGCCSFVLEEKPMANLFTLSAMHDVYADAYLADDSGRLLFLSVWGRDTALQELLARLQLPRSENGLREFNLLNGESKRLVSVPNVDELDKITSKTPSHTIFGVLTQLWIYDQLAIRPDRVNHRALMLYDTEDGMPDLWPLMKTVCPLPLLDSWKETFLTRCRQQHWIKPLENGAGVAGISIELDDGLEPMMTEMIHRGELTLPLTA